MSKIFEEALADAKKLRTVAEENAKKAILESVTPKIREFIEEQLLETKDEEDLDEASEEDEHDENNQIDEAMVKDLLGLVGGADLFESLNHSEEKDVIKKAISMAASKLNSKEKSNRILEICKIFKATNYITGESSKNYLNDLEFKNESIEVHYEDYSNYPTYKQNWGEFIHQVSIVDLLFNCGLNSSKYLKFTNNVN